MKKVPGLWNIFADEYGNIYRYSIHANGEGIFKCLDGEKDKRGYIRIRVRGRRYGAHQLVLMAFVGLCPAGMEGCHNDGKSYNNKLSNLRWDTKRNNNLDSLRHGTNRSQILCAEDVREIRELYKTSALTQKEIGYKYGVNSRTISDIICGVKWSHIK